MIAKVRDVSHAQVALAWMLSKPAVTAPIVGASRPAPLAELLQATEVKLDDEEIAELETAYLPHPVVGFR